MNTQQDLQFYDILLYKSMQPYPLRDDIFRIQTEGEYSKNMPDVRNNVVKLLKFSNYQTGVERFTGLPVPKLTKQASSKSPKRLNHGLQSSLLERIDEEGN
jgi:hypothetical protein